MFCGNARREDAVMLTMTRTAPPKLHVYTMPVVRELPRPAVDARQGAGGW